MNAVVLELRDVNLKFGGITVLDGLKLDVQDGSVHSLVGPNGAGKTSVLNCISGFYTPTSGTIVYRGTDLVGRRPDRIAALEVARVFQNIELFPHLTVLENVLIGRHRHFAYGPWASAMPFGKVQKQERLHRAACREVIEMIGLEHILDTPVAALPYGLEKKVELARALVAEPDLLLLDEPFGGLNADEKRDMAGHVRAVASTGKTVVLIDHDVQVVADISDTVTVLNYGRKIAEGTAHEAFANPAVIEAYMGTQRIAKEQGHDTAEVAR